MPPATAGGRAHSRAFGAGFKGQPPEVHGPGVAIDPAKVHGRIFAALAGSCWITISQLVPAPS